MDSTLSLLVKFAALDRLTAPLRTMTGSARKAAAELANAKKEVLALERSAGKVDGLKKLEATSASTVAKLEAARAKVEALKAAMKEAGAPTARLAVQLMNAESRVGRLTDRTGAQTDRLTRMRTELRAAGVDVEHLGQAEQDLAARIATANARLDEQRAKSERVAAAASRIEAAGRRGENLRAGGTRALAAGAAIGAPALAVAGVARDFDSTMTDIALKADMSAAAAERMKGAIQAAAPIAGQMPASLAESVDTLVGLGMSVNDALKNAPALGRAATAYKAEMVDLANASFAVSDNLKVAQADTARTLDIMARAGKAGAFELRDMAQYFPQLTASAQALGQTGVPAVADLAAALQIARKGAGDAGTAANNLQNLLNKINTKDTYAAFAKVGVDLPAALKRAAKAGKSPIEEIVEQTIRATHGDMSKLAFLFQDAQVQAALRPLVQNLDQYRRIRSDALQATGTVEADFQQRLRTDPAARLQRFNAQWEVMKEKLGDRVLPAINKLIDKLGPVLDRMSTWIDQHPKAASALGTLVTALAGLLTMLGSVSIAIGFVWRPLVMVFGWIMRLGPVFGSLLGWLSRFRVVGIIVRVVMAAITAITAFFGAPLWLVLAIGAALVAAGVLIYKYWDQIKGAFMAGLNWFLGLAQRFRTAGLRLLGQLWQGIKGAFFTGLQWFASINLQMGRIGVQLVIGLINGVGSMFGALRNKIVALGKGAVGWFKGVLGIHSPSRVFAELGGHMMGGLALGLDRAAERPLARVRAVGRTLARTAAITLVAGQPATAAVAPGRAGGAGRPASGMAAPTQVHHHHHSYHITIQGGADPREQARQLMAEMRRLQASEHHASFADDD